MAISPSTQSRSSISRLNNFRLLNAPSTLCLFIGTYLSLPSSIYCINGGEAVIALGIAIMIGLFAITGIAYLIYLLIVKFLTRHYQNRIAKITRQNELDMIPVHIDHPEASENRLHGIIEDGRRNSREAVHGGGVVVARSRSSSSSSIGHVVPVNTSGAPVVSMRSVEEAAQGRVRIINRPNSRHVRVVRTTRVAAGGDSSHPYDSIPVNSSAANSDANSVSSERESSIRIVRERAAETPKSASSVVSHTLSVNSNMSGYTPTSSAPSNPALQVEVPMKRKSIEVAEFKSPDSMMAGQEGPLSASSQQKATSPTTSSQKFYSSMSSVSTVGSKRVSNTMNSSGFTPASAVPVMSGGRNLYMSEGNPQVPVRSSSVSVVETSRS